MQSIQQILANAQQAQQQGQLETALKLYRQLLLEYPKEQSLQIACGNLCAQLGYFEEAAGHFRRILMFNKNPDVRNALCYSLQGLGNAAHTEGKFTLAAACFEEALLHQPNNAIFWYNLGNAQRELGQVPQALASYQRSIQIDPSDADAYNNLGNVQREMGALDLAIAAYKKALQLNPNLHHALAHLVHQKQHVCDWQDLNAQISTLRDWVKNLPEAQIPPFAFLGMPGVTAAEQRLCASRYVSQNYQKLRALREQLGFTYTKNKKIRIGYLSADFRLHPLAFLVTELIENHDKKQFETYAYSYGINDKSAARKRLESAFDCFRDIRQLSDIDAAKQINADQIDFLIDLTGFTQNCRTGIVALKPARTSINWLGYPGTMGSFSHEHDAEPLFDWLIADNIVVQNAQDISEQVLYLPCYQPNNRRDIGAKTEKSAHGLGESFIFCCFNQTFKITPELFAVWMRLLKNVPDSALWLLDCNPWAKANLQREAESAGVGKERLIFAPRANINAHMERQHHADLFLDTLPYNAHTTASDALFMGLPLVTCLGDTFPSRVAASLLQRMGLPELITESLQAYEEKALFLAQHPDEMARVKQKLAMQKTASHLFQAQQFARDLEALLQTLVIE